MFSRIKDKFPVYAFFAALLLRALFVLLYPRTVYPDEHTWSFLASALAGGQGFLSHLRPPGYIAFLALIYKIFGGGNTIAVYIIQAILGSLAVLCLYFLTLEVFKSKRTARIATAFLIFYPYLIFYSAHILSETLYSFLITAAVMFLYCGAEKNSKRFFFFVFAGFFTGLAVLTKATFLSVFPFFLMWFFLNNVSAKKIVFFFLACFAVIAPWSARNYAKYRTFVTVTPSGSYLFQANNARTLEIEKNTRLLNEVEWYTDEYTEIEKLPVMDADKEYRRRAFEFMRKNPATTLKLMRMRFFHFWRFYPITKSALERTAAFVTSGPVIILGLAGMILSGRLWRRTFFLMALIFTFNVVHIFFICTLRYRIPIDFVFMIFAAFTVNYIIEKWFSPLKKRFSPLSKGSKRGFRRQGRFVGKGG